MEKIRFYWGAQRIHKRKIFSIQTRRAWPCIAERNGAVRSSRVLPLQWENNLNILENRKLCTMQVTTAQKINKHHEAVKPYYRGTRCKANRQRKPYLRSPTPQRNGVQPWDRRQVFRSVWQHHAEDKCPGNRAGRRFSALGIVREQGCPKPFCNIASEGRNCNVEERWGRNPWIARPERERPKTYPKKNFFCITYIYPRDTSSTSVFIC